MWSCVAVTLFGLSYLLWSYMVLCGHIWPYMASFFVVLWPYIALSRSHKSKFISSYFQKVLLDNEYGFMSKIITLNCNQIRLRLFNISLYYEAFLENTV